ncbi:MAG: putative DNA-binding domain-containing protein [Dokdonella sp.]
MSALSQLETRFLDHVRSNGVRAVDADACVDGIVPARVGLSIYAIAYRARLREALDNDHPMLALYLGDALWMQFCDGYIDAHPSRVRSLRDFGASVPSYLSRQSPFAAQPQIAELAQFERLLLDVFDAPEAAVVEWHDMLGLAAKAWPALRLQLHPSVRVMHCATAVVSIWRALKSGESPPTTLHSSAPATLLWRDAERISRFRSIAADELAAIGAFVAGADFAAVCDTLVALHAAPQVPAIAVALLQSWFNDGLVAAFDSSASISDSLAID